jgi:hypothetical protein
MIAVKLTCQVFHFGALFAHTGQFVSNLEVVI